MVLPAQSTRTTEGVVLSRHQAPDAPSGGSSAVVAKRHLLSPAARARAVLVLSFACGFLLLAAPLALILSGGLGGADDGTGRSGGVFSGGTGTGNGGGDAGSGGALSTASSGFAIPGGATGAAGGPGGVGAVGVAGPGGAAGATGVAAAGGPGGGAAGGGAAGGGAAGGGGGVLAGSGGSGSGGGTGSGGAGTGGGGSTGGSGGGSGGGGGASSSSPCVCQVIGGVVSSATSTAGSIVTSVAPKISVAPLPTPTVPKLTLP